MALVAPFAPARPARPARPAPPGPRARGLTLIELMVTIAIFVVLSSMVMVMIRQVIARWSDGERRRMIVERAAGALERISCDLEAVLGRDPDGVTEVKSRFIADYDGSGLSRVFFVRSFETGPERALTFTAGSGRAYDLQFLPPGNEASPPAPGGSGGGRGGGKGGGRGGAGPPGPRAAPESESFTGRKVGSFRALGGMAMVAYFVQDGTLYRSIRAPVEGSLQELTTEVYRSPLMEDCLFFGLEYWSGRTQTWQQSNPRVKQFGPELIWDSTRGIAAPPLNNFFLHEGAESLNQPGDDVFPMLVRVTLTVDAPMPRALHTRLLREFGPSDVDLFVESTAGFPAGGGADCYVLLECPPCRENPFGEREWIHYREKKEDRFVVDGSGARLLGADKYHVPKKHPADVTVVRTGRTFTRTIFLPCYHE